MIKASIIGASGYTGSELMRILVNHPDLELADLTARSKANTKIATTYPHLLPYLGDKKFVKLNINHIKTHSNVVFICLPHGHAMDMAQVFEGSGVKVIDLGADFRIKDPKVYENYYNTPQTAPELLEKAVYGLTEYNREAIKNADIIANPGCFVTTSLLALLPLLPVMKAGLVEKDSVIIDAKSGVSGAGREAKVDNLLSELSNNFRAYNPTAHRHIPEIEQELGPDVTVQFTPHLIPTERGIFTTIYAQPTKEVSEEDLRQVYSEVYGDEYFIHLLDKGLLPSMKTVKGSNHCYIQVKKDDRTGRVVIFSVLDNLVKGAAGQAVQNMNVMFDIEEKTALTQVGLMP